MGNAILEMGLYNSNLIPLPDVKFFCDFFGPRIFRKNFSKNHNFFSKIKSILIVV